MTVEIPKVTYSGKIINITLGQGDKAVKVGGETAYPFHLFEGEMPNLPMIAMEVWDSPPEDWAKAALAPFDGVTNDPVAWAKKCVNEYGAQMICLQLVSADANGMNRSAEEVAETVKKVADAINVPLIAWGVPNQSKTDEVLRAVAEKCQGKQLIIGPVEVEWHKRVGAAAIAYKHTVIASTPIDVNLCKQLNILLGSVPVPEEKIMIDPTVSSIGYGIEYAYSVMERIRMAALVQQDDKLRYPIFCNISKETWKAKEVHSPESETPELGDATKRGVLMEAMSAVTLLMAGADLLVMRHPEAVKLVKEMLAELTAAQ